MPCKHGHCNMQDCDQEHCGWYEEREAPAEHTNEANEANEANVDLIEALETIISLAESHIDALFGFNHDEDRYHTDCLNKIQQWFEGYKKSTTPDPAITCDLCGMTIYKSGYLTHMLCRHRDHIDNLKTEKTNER